MILLKNATVFAPRFQGVQDVLIAGEQIQRVAPDLRMDTNVTLETVDLEERWLIPGLIDAHCHISGAGGEGGPVSRTGEVKLEHLLGKGITTVVGCLGTDGISRSPKSVLMKAKALNLQGMSAYMYTGAYQCPPPVITHGVTEDILFIEEVIGAGEIALGDHRSSFPDLNSFIRVCQQARLGGVLSGKAGVVNIHLGELGDPFEILMQAVERGLEYSQFLPTHCNRNERVFSRAMEYGTQGFIDFTTSSYPFFPEEEIKPSEALEQSLRQGVPLSHITFSTDAGGALPRRDARGRYSIIHQGDPGSLWVEVLDALKTADEDLSRTGDILSVATSNVADRLGLDTKGRIEEGKDADLLVVDKERERVDAAIARGKFRVRKGRWCG